jgi:glyoxylase-like metal-dependent hydrolase (beta-lactamase superfamily II)
MDGSFEPLRFPAATPPKPGETLPAAPGVLWLRMPLPFALDHINLWLLEDGPGWTIVDTGYAMPESKAAWERVFAEYLGGRPVTRIVVTHFHPDHIGLAAWLAERWRAPLWITEKEWLYARVMSRGSEDFVALRRDFARRAGLDAAASELFGERETSYRRGVPSVPAAFRRIADGGALDIGGRKWRVAVGEGHAPELACLFCAEAGVLIAGDQVLPRICPMSACTRTSPTATRWRNISHPSPSCAKRCRRKPWCCRRTICRFTACTHASTNWRRITQSGARSCSPS